MYKTVGIRFLIDADDKYISEAQKHFGEILYDIVAVIERRTGLIVDTAYTFADYGDGEVEAEHNVSHD